MDKLNLDQHISRQFNEELEDVRNKVLLMGGLVEGQLKNAVTALVTGNAELGRQVVQEDYKVNSLEVEVDEECTRIVARRQPAASDLRLVMAVIKTITDLERIGDEAKRVGKMVENELHGMLPEDIRGEIEHMGEMVSSMLKDVLDAFARTSVEAAVGVVAADDKVDIKYNAITRQLMTHMMEDPSSIPTVLKVMWATRSMERIGDRCENIAEYVIYLVKGKDVRHTKKADLAAMND